LIVSGFRERAFLPVLLFIGAVVSVISSLGAPLIPHLAQELHASLASTQWALTATLVVAAVASPLVGRLGDGRHRKRVILACLLAVVVGGALAALATSLPLLIAGRGLQGLGLALMPLTMAAAREHLPPAEAGRAIAALSVLGAAAVGLGYPLTGLIADSFDVATAYWFGTAVSVIALVLAAVILPEAAGASRPGRLDIVGAVLSAVGIVAVLIGLEKAPDWGWTAPRTIVPLVAGVALLGVWVVHELRVAHPLVDLRLVRHRAVLTANVTGFLLGATMYLSMILITQLVQLPTFGFGTSIFVAGLTLIPLSILSTASSRTLPWLQRRFGTRPIIPAGALAASAASLFFAFTIDHLWQAFVTTGILGIGLGLTFAAMPGLIVGAVPRHETGSAMGFYQVSRFVGFALGSGVAITLLRAFGDGGVPTLGAYRSTALVAAGLAAATAVVAWILPGRAEPARITDVDERTRQEGLLGPAGLETLEADASATTPARAADLHMSTRLR
jgi:MFS family permease